MTKRILSLLLALAMCLTILPSAAFAAETLPETSGETAEVFAETCIPETDLPSSDDLFAGYVEQLFSPWGGAGAYSVGVRTAGSQLTGDEKLVYDALVPIVKAIAAGERASAVVVLGAGATNAGEQLTFSGTFDDFDLKSLMAAVLTDHPYQMYWYDKTSGVALRGSQYSDSGRIASLSFGFSVAGTYQPEGYNADAPAVDTTKTGAASAAVVNAQAVVSANAARSDYEKLVAYRDYICSAVSYNTAAADETYTGGYGDPWQLIYVFDGNPDTNVVCEGYSKAFQYLCDLSAFTGDVSCYTVTGQMVGGTGAGGHMWNIVTMEDGKNYLVDVTNSEAGTVGQGGELFLAGGAQEDNDSCSVTLTYSDGKKETVWLKGYLFTNTSPNTGFYYDYDLFWGEDVTTLADSSYEPPSAPVTESVTAFVEHVAGPNVTAEDGNAVYTYTLTAVPFPELTGDAQTYTLESSAPLDAMQPGSVWVFEKDADNRVANWEEVSAAYAVYTGLGSVVLGKPVIRVYGTDNRYYTYTVASANGNWDAVQIMEETAVNMLLRCYTDPANPNQIHVYTAQFSNDAWTCVNADVAYDQDADAWRAGGTDYTVKDGVVFVSYGELNAQTSEDADYVWTAYGSGAFEARGDLAASGLTDCLYVTEDAQIIAGAVAFAGDAPTLPKLSAPDDVRWNLKREGSDSVGTTLCGAISFRRVFDQARYRVELYETGADGSKTEVDISATAVSPFAEDVGYVTLTDFLKELADYEGFDPGTTHKLSFCICAQGDGVNYQNSEWVESDIWEYTVPQAQLRAPADMVWNGEFLSWTLPDADKIAFTATGKYYAPTQANEPEWIGGEWGDFVETRVGIGSYYTDRYGNGYYYVAVRSISNDVTQYRSSAWSELSPAYVQAADTQQVHGSLQEIVQDAGISSAQQAQQAIKNAGIQTGDLADAMAADKTGTETLAVIGALEAKTGVTTNISVSETMQGSIPVEGISVTGAALNADEGTTSVTLSVGEADNGIVIPAQYQNTVQFSMSLKGGVNENNPRGQELAVPMKITLPVPANVNPAFLMILHYHAGNRDYDEILPYIYQEGGKWYATFVVTSFSNFVIVDEAPVPARAQRTATGVQVHLELTTQDASVSVFIAVYDAYGKMLTLAEKTLTDGVSSVDIACDAQAADSVKIFLLGAGSLPLNVATELDV